MATPPSSTRAPQSASAAALLDSAIIPTLRLAKAATTGLGIPGVPLEPVINGVLELATMLSTMKANKKDLPKLEEALKNLIMINTSRTTGDLKQRLDKLSSELTKILDECKSLTSGYPEYTGQLVNGPWCGYPLADMPWY
ncbi:hypothetical protein B0H16DRAFT_1893821 [Mycena metata]|uniref:Uncharacterized protein n=1 Tax=Mycena metata TaxID=1033252 RepID=A0AAD7HVY0_9AGAR|nr:hypothetical protein B0H16DRAFT_1893821 [Mycena metata]